MEKEHEVKRQEYEQAKLGFTMREVKEIKKALEDKSPGQRIEYLKDRLLAIKQSLYEGDNYTWLMADDLKTWIKAEIKRQKLELKKLDWKGSFKDFAGLIDILNELKLLQTDHKGICGVFTCKGKKISVTKLQKEISRINNPNEKDYHLLGLWQKLDKACKKRNPKTD